MMGTRVNRPRTRSQGQVIVIFAVAMVALLAMTGLIIDGGHAWAEQRHVQNAADAAARAGALVLARRSGDATMDPPPPPPSVAWGEQVRNEVYLSAATNGVTIDRATYTDWTGTVIAGEFVDGRTPPAGAAGVEVYATNSFQTSLVRIVGQTDWRLTQPATAVSGPSAGCLDTLEGCALLPIAFPVTVLACGSGNTSVPELPTRQWDTGVEVTIPLCGGNPGSVGWIDWTVPYGGTSELTGDILDPPTQDIPLPSWKFITATGNVSAAQVEDALNTYAGQVVMFPMFDSTCASTPANDELDGCPPGDVGGNGTNQWYHIPFFLAFQFASPKGAFTNGDYSVICSEANAKECIKGAFVALVGEGNVGGPCPVEGCPTGTSWAVQLVR
jgi:hypothetical protein